MAITENQAAFEAHQATLKNKIEKAVDTSIETKNLFPLLLLRREVLHESWEATHSPAISRLIQKNENIAPENWTTFWAQHTDDRNHQHLWENFLRLRTLETTYSLFDEVVTSKRQTIKDIFTDENARLAFYKSMNRVRNQFNHVFETINNTFYQMMHDHLNSNVWNPRLERLNDHVFHPLPFDRLFTFNADDQSDPGTMRAPIAVDTSTNAATNQSIKVAPNAPKDKPAHPPYTEEHIRLIAKHIGAYKELQQILVTTETAEKLLALGTDVWVPLIHDLNDALPIHSPVNLGSTAAVETVSGATRTAGTIPQTTETQRGATSAMPPSQNQPQPLTPFTAEMVQSILLHYILMLD